jgi:hypothetical protein
MGKVLYPGGLFPPYYGFYGFCSYTSDIESSGITGGLLPIMALVWRVRQIKFTSTWLGDPDDPAIITLTSTATTEEELVCGSIFQGATNKGHFILPEGEDVFTTQYFVQGGGVVAYLDVRIEGEGTEVGWGSTYNTYSNFAIGKTSLNASMGFTFPDLETPISVECTQFWSYGGTYDTATGAKR